MNTRRVKIGDVNKLLFTLTSNSGKSMIVFLYSFNLFKGPVIIPVGYNGFQHSGSKSSTSIKPIVDPVLIEIAVIYYHSPSRVVKFVKQLCLKFFKIDLNTCPETTVFIACGCILIKHVYCILIVYVIVSCAKVKPMSKKSF